MDLGAQVEEVADHAEDRAEHLERTVDRLARLAGEVLDDDLGDLPPRDDAARVDLVADEVDPVLDLDPPRDVAAERAASGVDVVERRAEDPVRQDPQPEREDLPAG